MSCTHEIAQKIPWYAAGTLDEDSRREVERHLEACPACREALELAATFVAYGERHSSESLDDHVHAVLLTDYVNQPGRLDAGVLERIEAHVASCDLCGETAAIVRALPPAEAQTEASPSVLAGWWAALSSTVLRPVPALAYLLLLVISYPLYRSLIPSTDLPPPEEPRVTIAAEGVMRIAFLKRSSRDTAGLQEIPVPADGGLVYLGIEPQLPESDADGRLYRLEIESETAVIWTHELSAAEIRAAMASDQLAVIFAVPAAALAPGGYSLRLSGADGSPSVLESTFEVVRPLPSGEDLGNP